MYNALLVLFLAIAAFLLIRGIQKRRLGLALAGVGVGVLTLAFLNLLGFWGEVLWFQALGYGDRIWTEIMAKVLLGIGGLVVGAVIVWLLTLSLRGWRKTTRLWAVLAGAIVGGAWGLSNWEVVLMYQHRVETGLREPILGQDTGFYLFALPLYDGLYTLLALLSLVALIGSLGALFLRTEGEEVKFAEPQDMPAEGGRGYGAFYVSAAVLTFSLAAGKFLARYHVLGSEWGVVHGPGWTDVHSRLPAYTIVAVITALVGFALLVPGLRHRLGSWSQSLRREGRGGPAVVYAVGTAGAGMLATWFLALTVVPGLVQWLRVEPNEISLERPYIAHNIEFTRNGFNIHKVEEHEYPAQAEFTRQTVEENPRVFNNIRLWDWRALDAVYKQFQEIRLYYEFTDVDIDRYSFADQYRQVMVSARELEIGNLPPQSQTFVNERFKYTHGYGITLATVNEFTPEGLPHLLIKDIPPASEHPELEVSRPEIYYGELTTYPAVVNSQEEEFDYPRGEENAYVRYQGEGGVLLSSLWRKFLFGYKFDGTRFFLSSYPREDSRVQFRRQVGQRVRAIAPFLQFDNDPYVILVDGRLKWIVDCYTTSPHYPYSEPFSGEFLEYRDGYVRGLRTGAGLQLRGINYIRNSAKAVIDAYDGSVDFYVFDPEDPLIRVWDRVFPGVFQSMDQMDPAVRDHVRYPVDMLLVQGLVFAKYHMTDPTVFYNQEDLWIRGTEKYYSGVQPVEPYYVMWELPESNQAEFSLILPFTPKNRQVLIGWIAGLCDGDNYGRLLAYKFPKERRVIGPQQVETKIDQDPYLSGQLTLWDQRGSNVIRGNVLAIPIGGTLIYVEPIYLQAETAAYPELRLVAVMHEDDLSYAETFSDAVAGLFGEGPPAREIGPGGVTAAAVPWRTAARQADRAFGHYLDALGTRSFGRAATQLDSLQQALDQLMRSASRGNQDDGEG